MRRLFIASCLTVSLGFGGCSGGKNEPSPESAKQEAKTGDGKDSSSAEKNSESTDASAPAEKVKVSTGQLDLSFIHKDFAGALIVHPQRCVAAPGAEEVKKFLQTDMPKKWIAEFGIDPFALEQVMFLLGPATQDGDEGIPVTPGVIARFMEPIDPESLAKGFFEDSVEVKGEFEGRLFMQRDSLQPSGTYFPDRQTMLLATEKSLTRMIAAKKVDSPLVRALAAVSADNDVLLVGAMEPVRALAKQFSEQAEDKVPGELKPFLTLPELVESLVVAINFKGKELARVEFTCVDDDASNTLEALASVGSDLLNHKYRTFRAEIAEAPLPEFAKPILEMVQAMLDGISVERKELHVTVRVPRPEGLEKVPGLLASAAEIAMRKAQLAVGMNNLRQVGFAQQMYALQSKHLAMDSKNARGTPLLSWRVRMLPYLEQNGLYEQFKLDEPWDSEHNLKLVDKMPTVFGNSTDGTTRFQVFVGEGAFVQSGEPMSLSQVLDGTSNTILMVETGPDKAVPWTKPADVAFDPNDPIKALGTLGNEGFPAVYFDGHARRLPKEIDPKQLKALITHAGGEVVEIDQ